MCQNQLRKSGLDLRNLDLGVGLSVALCSAIAFFRLHLVDADLLALAVFDDIAGNDGVFHHGGAENSLVLVDDSQNAVKLHSLAGLDIQLLDEDDVALGGRTGYLFIEGEKDGDRKKTLEDQSG